MLSLVTIIVLIVSKVELAYFAAPALCREDFAVHWRRLDKNSGWANQNIGGQKVVKSEKCMGVSQLLGARAPAAPQSLRLSCIPKSISSPLTLYTAKTYKEKQTKRTHGASIAYQVD